MWSTRFCDIVDAKVVRFSMVPVLAVGFDALNARVEAQSAQASAQQEKLKVTSIY